MRAAKGTYLRVLFPRSQILGIPCGLGEPKDKFPHIAVAIKLELDGLLKEVVEQAGLAVDDDLMHLGQRSMKIGLGWSEKKLLVRQRITDKGKPVQGEQVSPLCRSTALG